MQSAIKLAYSKHISRSNASCWRVVQERQLCLSGWHGMVCRSLALPNGWSSYLTSPAESRRGQLDYSRCPPIYWGTRTRRPRQAKVNPKFPRLFNSGRKCSAHLEPRPGQPWIVPGRPGLSAGRPPAALPGVEVLLLGPVLGAGNSSHVYEEWTTLMDLSRWKGDKWP